MDAAKRHKEEQINLAEQELRQVAETADVISSFVYRRGILEANFSYTTAVDFFNAFISFGLVMLTNSLSKRKTEYGLW